MRHLSCWFFDLFYLIFSELNQELHSRQTLNGAIYYNVAGFRRCRMAPKAERHLVTSSQKVTSIVRQPCRRIRFNKEDLGQWLYVPSFRTVCLFQDSL